MLGLDCKNLFTVSKTHGLTARDYASQAARLPLYLDKIARRDQGFYTMIDDTRVIERIERHVRSVRGQFRDIVLLGIGGSALGALCIQQSLTHLYENELPNRKSPRFHVLDNIDPVMIREIEDIIDYATTLFIVVTKSGGTPETVSQYFYFRSRVHAQKCDPKKHFVFVTDPKTGLLRRIAEDERIFVFDIPPNVGGRFSVLTAAGLLPAAYIGVNIRQLIKGAQEMRDRFLSTSFEDNLPFQIASTQYLLGKKGKDIHVIMPYAQKLIRFADWYRQLLAESIGKAKNEKDKIVHAGLTPVNALGVTDQHSQSQLYNEGPNDKFIMFITVNDMGKTLRIPALYPDDSSVAFLHNTSFNELMHVEKQGTALAYTKNNRPNITITIDAIDPYHLGQLCMLFEGATAFLGEFYGVNAFNQPGVELAKQLTKKLLSH